MECAGCGATLAPGASFCRACGEEVAVAGAKAARPSARATPTATPNPAAAVALLAAPGIAFVAIVAVSTLLGSGVMGAGLFLLVPMLGVTAPLAWGLWQGRLWARTLTLLVAIGWAGFMGWAALENFSSLTSMGGFDSRFGVVNLVGFVLIVCEFVVALVVLVLVWRRR